MSPISAVRNQVLDVIQACEEKKAQDITILELEKNSGAFTDYFVIASGANPRQIQSIADSVQEKLKAHGMRPTHAEGYNQAEWVLLDYVDFVVHVFSERARKFYDLERLWRSARALATTDFTAKPKRATRPAARTRAKAKSLHQSSARSSAKKKKPGRRKKSS